jgi:hypothetical protein
MAAVGRIERPAEQADTAAAAIGEARRQIDAGMVGG